MSFFIAGTGSALPERTVTNNELSQYVDTTDEWISTRTGISSRHVMTDETLLDLAYEAALQALKDSDTEADDLDYILVGTIQGDYITPSLACLLQKKLGSSCPAMDINAACSGFLYALDTADSYFKADKANTILVVCAEALSKVTNWTDRATCVLFGDGAGAAVLKKGKGLLAIKTSSDGNSKHLFAKINPLPSPFTADENPKNGLVMNGQEVYKFAVNAVITDCEYLLNATKMPAEDITYFILHQANKRIIDTARQKLRQPHEKFPSNISSYGNTSGASIPILLDELNRAQKLKKGDKLLLSAFGAGFTTGACIIEWQK